MIVVDTNLLAYLMLPGERTEAAEAVWRADSDWHAPELWRSEFRNILALQMRNRRLALADAVAVASEAEHLMAGREHRVDTGHVLRLAAGCDSSAYDCEFVALAEALSTPLITADRELAEAFPALAAMPEEFGGAGG